MLEKYQSFFAEDGITSTSANHLCNIARERIALDKAKMAQLNFVTLAVGVLGSDKPLTVIRKGTENAEEINTCIHNIAKSNAFIAYMQEAIKAKKDLYSTVMSMQFEEYLKVKNIEEPLCPKRGEKKTFDEAFAEMSIKEKCHYYTLEAEAAAIGKIIHPDGAFHIAREEMLKALSAPAYIEDDKVYHREIVADQEKVEALYFELQKKHRAVEAELNSIKNSIDVKVREYNTALDSKFSVEYNEATTKLTALHNDFANWRNEEGKRINKLKIAVPKALQESYEYLVNL